MKGKTNKETKKEKNALTGGMPRPTNSEKKMKQIHQERK